MFCPDQPPPAPEGEGSERVFGMEVTKYRCKNGFQWPNGKWPYLEMECLNKKWAPKTLPECVREYKLNIFDDTFLFLQHEAVVWLSPPLWWEWMWPGRTRSGSLVTQSRTPVQARPLPGRSTWSTSWSSASGTGRPTAWSGGLRSFTTATVRLCCTRSIQSFQNISNALSTFWAKELILKGIKR